MFCNYPGFFVLVRLRVFVFVIHDVYKDKDVV